VKEEHAKVAHLFHPVTVVLPKDGSCPVEGVQQDSLPLQERMKPPAQFFLFFFGHLDSLCVCSLRQCQNVTCFPHIFFQYCYQSSSVFGVFLEGGTILGLRNWVPYLSAAINQLEMTIAKLYALVYASS
jgi:hypothetical protein